MSETTSTTKHAALPFSPLTAAGLAAAIEQQRNGEWSLHYALCTANTDRALAEVRRTSGLAA